MSADVLYILLLTGLVFGGLALGLHWLRTLADLLWMATIRPYVVGPSVVASILAASFTLDALIHRQGLVATRFILLLIVAPILAKPLSNVLASLRARALFDWKNPLAKDFIFRRARQIQQDAFVASLAPPQTLAGRPEPQAGPVDPQAVRPGQEPIAPR